MEIFSFDHMGACMVPLNESDCTMASIDFRISLADLYATTNAAA